MRNRHSRFGKGEREHHRIRRKLLRIFRDRADAKGITFSVIARCCNTSESRGWQLLNGPIEQFNSETLIDVLWRFGVTVDVVVTSTRPVPIRLGDPDAMEFPPRPPFTVFKDQTRGSRQGPALRDC